ncbi:hypothetical protein GGF50DRAFT_92302 [Schizophyllum commune]
MGALGQSAHQHCAGDEGPRKRRRMDEGYAGAARPRYKDQPAPNAVKIPDFGALLLESCDACNIRKIHWAARVRTCKRCFGNRRHFVDEATALDDLKDVRGAWPGSQLKLLPPVIMGTTNPPPPPESRKALLSPFYMTLSIDELIDELIDDYARDGVKQMSREGQKKWYRRKRRAMEGVFELVTLATSTSPSPTSSSSPSAPSTFSVSPSTPYSSSVARSTYPSTGVGVEVIKRALSGVSALMYGAAHLPADIRDRFLKTCAPHAVFSEGYGLSEASFAPIANLGPSPSSPPPSPSLPPSACGRPDNTATTSTEQKLVATVPTSTSTNTNQTLSAVGPPPDALAAATNTSKAGMATAPRGSVGRLMPGLKAKIVRGEEDDGDGSAGELYLSGPTIAAGYYNNPDATRETGSRRGRDGEKRERWLKTGDRFYVDRDGWFFFSDRAKDTLKVSGAQCSLRVLDVAVAGVRGHGRTADERVPRAWVVLGGMGGVGVAPEYSAADRAAIVAALDTHRIIAALHTWTRARLIRHKWLRGGIEVVGEIPKNPTGKVLRRVLVERYERGLEGRYERGVEEHTGQERGSKIGKLLKAKL